MDINNIEFVESKVTSNVKEFENIVPENLDEISILIK